MPPLPLNVSLSELQKYVAAFEVDRGFASESALQKCLLLGEEVGELFKAVRKDVGIKIDRSSNVNPVGEELADILMFVVAIANRFEIDLESALRNKEVRNSGRIWS